MNTNTIIVQLTAGDLKNVPFDIFCMPYNCPITKVVRKMFNAGLYSVHTYYDGVHLNGDVYAMKKYGPIQFKWDRFKSKFCRDNTVIRTITLTKKYQ